MVNSAPLGVEIAKLLPRRAPRAFAAFRLATIYLPHCLLLKWVVVKYSQQAPLLEVQQGRQKAVEEVPTGRQQPSTTEGWKGKTKADTAV
jgi:hypothetical protein